MAPKDRTQEFHSTLSSIRSRSSLPVSSTSAAKQPLLPAQPNASGKGKAREQGGGGKSEFARMAGGIGKDINSTTMKLQKLAQLAKRKTLFDDRPVEISELTYIIRQDISSLNSQIATLQTYLRTQKSQSSAAAKQKKGEGQVEEHNSNVVMLLQSRLANMGMGFKDVLELRTQNMKASKDRTEQFMHTSAGAAVPVPNNNSVLFSSPSTSSLPSTSQAATASGLLQPHSHSLANTRAGTPNSYAAGRTSGDFLALNMGDGGEDGLGRGGGRGGQGGMMQMQLVEQQDTYIQSRSTAIESIESTIAELGQIFTQLAGMVAEQRETVQRIDADVTDISSNVTGAQRELLKYYASVTSNRWLMLKIFGVLIIFFLVFILVS